MNRRRFVQLLVAGGAAAGLGAWTSACGTESGASSVRSGTIALSQLPPDVAALYRYVEANQPIAKRIPCYCGCGQHSGHKSVRDCFINGKGQYDDHASGCDICLDIAQQTQQLSRQGLDVTAIRARIDQQFGQYGPPTNTR
jgi:hypothetical protein